MTRSARDQAVARFLASPAARALDDPDDVAALAARELRDPALVVLARLRWRGDVG